MEELEGMMGYLDICCICCKPLNEDDEVETNAGPAHESCAERHYGPYDPNRDSGIPKG